MTHILSTYIEDAAWLDFQVSAVQLLFFLANWGFGKIEGTLLGVPDKGVYIGVLKP